MLTNNHSTMTPRQDSHIHRDGADQGRHIHYKSHSHLTDLPLAKGDGLHDRCSTGHHRVHCGVVKMLATNSVLPNFVDWLWRSLVWKSLHQWLDDFTSYYQSQHFSIDENVLHVYPIHFSFLHDIHPFNENIVLSPIVQHSNRKIGAGMLD